MPYLVQSTWRLSPNMLNMVWLRAKLKIYLVEGAMYQQILNGLYFYVRRLNGLNELARNKLYHQLSSNFSLASLHCLKYMIWNKDIYICICWIINAQNYISFVDHLLLVQNITMPFILNPKNSLTIDLKRSIETSFYFSSAICSSFTKNVTNEPLKGWVIV